MGVTMIVYLCILGVSAQDCERIEPTVIPTPGIGACERNVDAIADELLAQALAEGHNAQIYGTLCTTVEQ